MKTLVTKERKEKEKEKGKIDLLTSCCSR